MIQGGLFDRNEKLIREFEAFHAANPHVYDLVVKFTDIVRARGFKTYAIATIYERVRWHMDVDTTGDEFKLNNNHRAFYARMLIMERPELRSFLGLRMSVADDWPGPPGWKFSGTPVRSPGADGPPPGPYGRGAAE